MTTPQTPLSDSAADWGQPTDPLALLSRLRRRIRADDSTMEPLLSAAERVHSRWRRASDEVEAAWCRYEGSLAEEMRTRQVLGTLLRTMNELVRSERPLPAPGEGDPASVSADEVAPAAADGSPVAPPLLDLDVRLLGRFELLRCGRPLDRFHGPKTPRVLPYLLASHDRTVPREMLMDLFWSDAPPESARRSLHQTIYLIRRTLRDPDAPDHAYVVYEDEGYSIRAPAGFRCDVDDFERHAAEGRRFDALGEHALAAERYEEATALYRGDFLDDLPYDEWALTRRRHLRGLYLETANRLATLWHTSGRIDDALTLSQRVVELDPCDEAAHRTSMRCYATLGNRGLMNRQYLACVADLDRLLGVGPTSQTVELHEALVSDIAPAARGTRR